MFDRRDRGPALVFSVNLTTHVALGVIGPVEAGILRAVRLAELG